MSEMKCPWPRCEGTVNVKLSNVREKYCFTFTCTFGCNGPSRDTEEEALEDCESKITPKTVELEGKKYLLIEIDNKEQAMAETIKNFIKGKNYS